MVRDERDVRILERRLARRHPAEPDAVELRHDRLRHLGTDRGLDHDRLRLVALLDDDARDAVERPHAASASSPIP